MMFAQQTSQIRGFDFLSVARDEWAREQGEEKALPVRARFQNFFFSFLFDQATCPQGKGTGWRESGKEAMRGGKGQKHLAINITPLDCQVCTCVHVHTHVCRGRNP
jgi:hypothetical protein